MADGRETAHGSVSMMVEDLNFTLQHSKELKHNNADGLSRHSCGDCKQCAKMQGLKEVDSTDRSGLGEAARLVQAAGTPVQLPRKSHGYTPATHTGARASNPTGAPGDC